MKVTVKTIDAGSQDFELPDEATVGQLKGQILEKMGIGLELQRLIFQGKVLKDEMELKECGVDGKVIHLVKRPPPSVGQAASAEGQSSTGGGEEARNMTVQSSQDVVIVGNIPVTSHSDITQVTQNIVDQIVNSLTSQGAQAQVSAEAITTDFTGATHTTTVSGKSDPQDPEATPTPAAAAPLRPEPSSSTAEATPTPKEAKPARARTLADQAEEHEADQRRREAERNQRQLVTIFKHARTVRRCLVYATKVLERYERAAVRYAAKEARRKREAELAEAGATGGDLAEAAEPMEEEEEEEDESDSDEYIYEELDRSPDDPGTLSSALYLKFMDDILSLHKRIQPVIVKYKEHIGMNNDQAIRMQALQVSLTVKDFNYYIGHAYVSLSRLHINLAAAPPRTIRLAAPRRTEMRHMMTQFRGNPPPRAEAPSGYIVEISKEDENGEGGERNSTRAIVNRDSGGGARGSGGAEAPLNPLAGGMPGFGGLFSGIPGVDRSGLSSILNARKRKREAEKREARRKEAEEKAARGEGGSEDKPAQQEGEPQQGGGAPQADEQMEVEESVVQPKADASVGGEEGEGVRSVGDGEEVKSKLSGASGSERRVTPQEEGEREGEGEEGTKEKESGEEDGPADDETPQYLARLLSELITGVADPAGPHRPSKAKDDENAADDEKIESENADDASKSTKASGEGEGAGKEGEEAQEGEGDGRPRTFAERYAGPEGTTVTISAAPAPPFGIPGLPPMEGPSLSIKNPGDGAEPEMTINFPMPPAIQLLQSLLERAEERHRQRREAGETSSEESGDDEEEEEEEKGGVAKPEPKKKKPAKRIPGVNPDKAFLDEDGEILSISDAGSIDEIDSDHEQPSEMEHPMRQMAASAMSSLNEGVHVSMLDTMAEVRSHLGAPDSDDDEDKEEEDLGKVEDILKVISRELSVVEIMQVMKGQVAPAERLQPGLYNYIRDKLLNGDTPYTGRLVPAVDAFLANVIPTLRAVEDDLPLRDSNMDFPATVHNTLWGLLEEVYGYIVQEYTEKEKKDRTFSVNVHQWAIHASSVFSNVMRHCVDSDEHNIDLIKKLIACLFPPGTPSIILSMCGDNILKEMLRAREMFPFTPGEMDHYLVWKEGTYPTPNDKHEWSTYAMERDISHPQQPLPFPVKESCPGGETADQAAAASSEFPPGVPEEWVSAINRDSSADAACGPQQPFSDAYLAGMPAKRRKQLDTSEPSTISAQDLTLLLMDDALIKTGAQALNGKTQLEMLSLFHHSGTINIGVNNDLSSMLRSRYREMNPPFDKEKYPNITKQYRLNRRH